MKKIFIVLIAVIALLTLSIPCLAEIASTEGEESEDAQVITPKEESAPVEEYASEKTFAEIVEQILLDNWDAIAVAGYIIYKLLPKIGGIARSKKQASEFKETMATYFGDENSEKNVFSVQKSVAKAQELFMNDAGDMLEKIQAAVAPIKDFVEQSRNTEAARAATAQIALVVESAVELMASQLNDLVLASPSVSAKKKEEICDEWMTKIKEIHTIVEGVVKAYDNEDEVPSA